MAHRLEEVRRSKGLKQIFVAEQLGYSPSYYNTIERNVNYIPRLDTAKRMAELFGVSIDELFPGENLNEED